MNEMHTVSGDKKETTTNYYIALVCAILGAIALPLCFTPLGVYALIAGMLCEICALAFCEKQKKNKPLKSLKWINIIAYVVLGITALIFVGGIVYVYTNA